MSAHNQFDVIVVGGGHAGCEAALASARLGASTLLLTMNNDHIAQMSCNPAIGGIAKGQVVREIDALGGEMGKNADATSIQFRMLNESKGAAALSPRAQCDRAMYKQRMKLVLERQANLCIHQAEAADLVVRNHTVCGVKTVFGDVFFSKAVVLCTGTFLNGKLHFGLQSRPGGRAGDEAATHLTKCLVNKLGLEVGRLKTGTPVRVLGKTMDTSSLLRQDTWDGYIKGFSFGKPDKSIPIFNRLTLTPMSCFMTYSTEKTAEVVRANLSRSPMYSGRISGTGARYCPSFEDKIVRFSDRPRHHVYIEPEGESTDEYYLNGISTSMPVDVQWQMVRSLPGLENAFISRYAYAIEYDFVYPHQLDSSLAVKTWPSLFHAGQINGTSGYEEAAAQGLIAGINAARYAAGQPALRLGRDQAYIGVLIDDLITKEIVEPYRLFTSRAEFRLSLRQDNADRRLTKIGYDCGLASRESLNKVNKLERDLEKAKTELCAIKLEGVSVMELMSRPDFDYSAHDDLPKYTPRILEQLEIDARYSGYIAHQALQAKSLKKLEFCKIPADFDYDIPGLSTEAKIKLGKKRPENLGQASRIDGVTPAEIAVLQVRLKK